MPAAWPAIDNSGSLVCKLPLSTLMLVFRAATIAPRLDFLTLRRRTTTSETARRYGTRWFCGNKTGTSANAMPAPDQRTIYNKEDA